MSIPRFSSLVLLIAVAASVTTPLLIWRRSAAALLQQNAQIRSQAELAAQLASACEQLSNQVFQASAPNALKAAQLSELRKLRSEIGHLRAARAEADQLRAANRQLTASGNTASTSPPFDPTGIPNYWPKDQLGFYGYSSPEASLKTMLWAMKNGDLQAWLACLAPNIQDTVQKEWAKESQSTGGVAGLSKQMSDLLGPCSGFHIISQQEVSPDKVTMDLSFDGEGAHRPIALTRIGNDWKIDAIEMAGSPIK
jgi:hypothetical protein